MYIYIYIFTNIHTYLSLYTHLVVLFLPLLFLPSLPPPASPLPHQGTTGTTWTSTCARTCWT